MNLDASSGQALDAIGSLLGMSRANAEDDGEYRERLRPLATKVFRNKTVRSRCGYCGDDLHIKHCHCGRGLQDGSEQCVECFAKHTPSPISAFPNFGAWGQNVTY